METREVSANGVDNVGMNPFVRFANIFYAPSEVFASLTRSKWAWIAPIIVVFVIGSAAYPLIKTIVAEERMAGMADSFLFQNLPENQKEETMERMRESILHPPWWHWLIGIVTSFIPLLIAAGIMLLVANTILGGEAKYWMMMNVYAFSSLVAIPETIVKVPLIVSKQTLDIPTSLAILLPSDASGSFTYAFLNGIDIFSIWMTVLVVIGMGVALHRVSIGKIAFPISVLWLIWIALKSVIENAFGGGFGL